MSNLVINNTLFIFLVIFLFQGIPPGFAQAPLLVNNDVLFVNEGVNFSVNGHLLNRGNLTNRGTLLVSGNLVNENQFVSSTGTLVLFGENTQYLGLNNRTALSGFVVEGGGDKILENALNVTQTLDLYFGRVITNNNSITLENGAQVINASSDAYVIGNFLRSGTGYLDFPVGTENNYTPFVLEDASGVDPLLSVDITEPADTAGLARGDSIAALSVARQWELRVLSGSLNPSTVTLPVLDDESSPNPEFYVVGATRGEGSTIYSLERDPGSLPGTVRSQFRGGEGLYTLAINKLFSVEDELLVPSAFAPNSPDQEEQVMKVYAKNLSNENFSIRIYDRFGSLVFFSDSAGEMQTSGWNGTNTETGESVMSGVYTYQIQASFESGASLNKTGSVTLLR